MLLATIIVIVFKATTFINKVISKVNVREAMTVLAYK